MPGVITVTLEQSDLLLQQTTWITIVLMNTGRAPLEDMNPRNTEGWPTLQLTDLDSGNVQYFAITKPPRQRHFPENLPPGEKQESRFDLNRLMLIPHPGTFEIRAKAVWDGGEALSDPVKLTVRPIRPFSAHIATMYGSLTPLYFAAWSNAVDPEADEADIILSDIRIRRKTTVTDTITLARAPVGAKPVLSIAPNKPPEAQWVAWREVHKDVPDICFVLHHDGKISDVVRGKITSPGELVPPLMLDPGTPANPLPGATGLLYDSSSDKAPLKVVRLTPKGVAEEPIAATFPNGIMRWISTGYRADLSRRTFIVTQVGPLDMRLSLMPWSATQSPKAIDEIYKWDMKLLGAGLTTTQQNHIRGLFVGEKPGNVAPTYHLLAWVYSDKDKFIAADPIPINLPDDVKVLEAIPRINQNGAPYAILRTDGDVKCYVCRFDGSTEPRPNVPKDPRLPMDILFRAAEMPIMMYTDPKRGFQFVEPF